MNDGRMLRRFGDVEVRWSVVRPGRTDRRLWAMSMQQVRWVVNDVRAHRRTYRIVVGLLQMHALLSEAMQTKLLAVKQFTTSKRQR